MESTKYKHLRLRQNPFQGAYQHPQYNIENLQSSQNFVAKSSLMGDHMRNALTKLKRMASMEYIKPYYWNKNFFDTHRIKIKSLTDRS